MPVTVRSGRSRDAAGFKTRRSAFRKFGRPQAGIGPPDRLAVGRSGALARPADENSPKRNHSPLGFASADIDIIMQAADTNSQLLPASSQTRSCRRSRRRSRLRCPHSGRIRPRASDRRRVDLLRPSGRDQAAIRACTRWRAAAPRPRRPPRIAARRRSRDVTGRRCENAASRLNSPRPAESTSRNDRNPDDRRGIACEPSRAVPLARSGFMCAGHAGPDASARVTTGVQALGAARVLHGRRCAAIMASLAGMTVAAFVGTAPGQHGVMFVFRAAFAPQDGLRAPFTTTTSDGPPSRSSSSNSSRIL